MILQVRMPDDVELDYFLDDNGWLPISRGPGKRPLRCEVVGDGPAVFRPTLEQTREGLEAVMDRLETVLARSGYRGAIVEGARERVIAAFLVSSSVARVSLSAFRVSSSASSSLACARDESSSTCSA